MVEKIVPALLCLVCLSAESRAENFTEYLASFRYPEVERRVVPLEARELDRITGGPSGKTYPDRILRLYLVASEINTEPELGRYEAEVRGLVDGARAALGGGRYAGLDEYNRAEFLLGYLHDRLFKTSAAGSGAGYNVGIRETFDTGLFNCYKSALIYNGLLEYFGYRAGYVQVPNHIYSVVYVGGLPVEAETTSRYGFDPYGRGLPEFRRRFDAPNVVFNKREYRDKKEADRLSVLSQVYHNRASLYSGDAYYSGLSVTKDLERALALRFMGNYLDSAGDPWCYSNLLVTMMQYETEILRDDPARLPAEFDRFVKLMERPGYREQSAVTLRNFEILCASTLAKRRDLALGPAAGDSAAYDACVEECMGAEKYIRKNRDVKNICLSNAILSLYRTLESRHPSDRPESPYIMHRVMSPLFSIDFLRSNGEIQEKKRMLYRGMCVMINNTGVAAIQKSEPARAMNILNRGIRYALTEMKMEKTDSIIALMERNLGVASKMAK